MIQYQSSSLLDENHLLDPPSGYDNCFLISFPSAISGFPSMGLAGMHETLLTIPMITMKRIKIKKALDMFTFCVKPRKLLSVICDHIYRPNTQLYRVIPIWTLWSLLMLAPQCNKIDFKVERPERMQIIFTRANIDSAFVVILQCAKAINNRTVLKFIYKRPAKAGEKLPRAKWKIRKVFCE